MKLALIPPFQYLDYTGLTECQLMLPHLLNSTVYNATYSRLCADIRQFVILDNGAAEGATFDPGDLLNTAMQYRVDEVVASDVMGDAPGTAVATRAFLEKAAQLHYQGRVAVVAQGQDTTEAFHLAATLIEEWKSVTTVHLPRLLVQEANRTARLDLATRIFSMFPFIDIHLLGASSLWPEEIRTAADHYPFIRSVDTSMPFVYAIRGEYVDDFFVDVPHRMGDDKYFTHDLSKREKYLVRYNVDKMLSWVNGS